MASQTRWDDLTTSRAPAIRLHRSSYSELAKTAEILDLETILTMELFIKLL